MSRLAKIGDWFEQRLKIWPMVQETAEHRVPQVRQLVLRLRQRGAHRFHAADLHRHHAGADLCAFRGRGLEQSAVPQSWRHAGMVSARGAWMGIELHGRHRAHPHGAGGDVRGLQVSPRADLDRWHLPAADDAGHGVHRPGAALRSGCVLGVRHRRLDLRPCAVHWRMGRTSAARWPHHRRATRCRGSSHFMCSSFPGC
jgi:hypothetical protein